MMKIYIVKYQPSEEFDKSKNRVLVRGGLQHLTGEEQRATILNKTSYYNFN